MCLTQALQEEVTGTHTELEARRHSAWPPKPPPSAVFGLGRWPTKLPLPLMNQKVTYCPSSRIALLRGKGVAVTQ